MNGAGAGARGRRGAADNPRARASGGRGGARGRWGAARRGADVARIRPRAPRPGPARPTRPGPARPAAPRRILPARLRLSAAARMRAPSSFMGDLSGKWAPEGLAGPEWSRAGQASQRPCPPMPAGRTCCVAPRRALATFAPQVGVAGPSRRGVAGHVRLAPRARAPGLLAARPSRHAARHLAFVPGAPLACHAARFPMTLPASPSPRGGLSRMSEPGSPWSSGWSGNLTLPIPSLAPGARLGGWVPGRAIQTLGHINTNGKLHAPGVRGLRHQESCFGAEPSRGCAPK